MQEEEGVRYPVLYLSQKLFSLEIRYSVVEKECLALKWALDSLKYYLLGQDFVIKMDHKVLNNMKDANSLLLLTVKYRSGVENIATDFLSHSPCENALVGGNYDG